MPRVIGKVEGRGNGIKTVIFNVMDLSLALKRDPGEVCKFFGTELGAQARREAKTKTDCEREHALYSSTKGRGRSRGCGDERRAEEKCRWANEITPRRDNSNRCGDEFVVSSTLENDPI